MAITKPAAGHYRAQKRMRAREVVAAAKALATVHQDNGTINAAGRALVELRSAVAVFEAAERDATHDRHAPPVVEPIPGDGCWVRLVVDGEAISMHPDEAAKLHADLGLLVLAKPDAGAEVRRRARDHIARKLALAKAGQGVLLTNEDAALLVEALG